MRDNSALDLIALVPHMLRQGPLPFGSGQTECNGRMSKRLVRRHEAIKRLGIGKTKFHSDIVERPGASENIPGTDVPRLRLVHLGPRISAAIEDELEDVIEGLRAARGAKPPDVREEGRPAASSNASKVCSTRAAITEEEMVRAPRRKSIIGKRRIGP